MKGFIATVVALLAFSVVGVGTAGNPSLCRSPNAQSASGAAFSSRAECAKAKEVFAPALSVTPSAVTAEQTFTVSGSGFHPLASVVFNIALTGQPPYYGVTVFADASGAVSISTYFTGCGDFPPYDLTLTVTDSYGVHAFAQMTLC